MSACNNISIVAAVLFMHATSIQLPHSGPRGTGQITYISAIFIYNSTNKPTVAGSGYSSTGRRQTRKNQSEDGVYCQPSPGRCLLNYLFL